MPCLYQAWCRNLSGVWHNCTTDILPIPLSRLALLSVSVVFIYPVLVLFPFNACFYLFYVLLQCWYQSLAAHHSLMPQCSCDFDPSHQCLCTPSTIVPLAIRILTKCDKMLHFESYPCSSIVKAFATSTITQHPRNA